LPKGLISARQAAVFSSILGLSGVVLLWLAFNPLTAILAAGTMLFYSLFYTLWLKPNTPQNIVIGGIAGAMAPVGAWTAATGGMALTPWILFAIVFFWTPPHFWSLALHFRSDYEKIDLPMMPVVKGFVATMRLILIYSVVLVVISLIYIPVAGGWIYGSVAVLLGITLIHRVRKGPESMWKLFTFSIFYLFGLFAAMTLDKIVAL
jgi:protoheme IX farnesyltransferase